MTVLTYGQLLEIRNEFCQWKGYPDMTTSTEAHGTGAIPPRSQVAKLQYQQPTDEQTERIKAVRQSYIDLCTQIENLIPDCQERSVAITNLRTALFWTNAAIVLNGGRPEPGA